MADQLSKHKPVSAAVCYRALRRFYNWMVSEEIVTNSPMAKVHQPHLPEQPVPILTEQELTALLKVTSGRTSTPAVTMQSYDCLSIRASGGRDGGVDGGRC